jgi:hypothetical protein
MPKRSVTLGMEPSLLTNKNGFFVHSLLSKKKTIQKKTKKKKHNEREKKHEKLSGRKKTRNKKLPSSQILKTKSKSISENLHNVPHGWRWRRAIREGAAAVEERSAERKQQQGR